MIWRGVRVDRDGVRERKIERFEVSVGVRAMHISLAIFCVNICKWYAEIRHALFTLFLFLVR